MDHYELRFWRGWHHHMTLVILAHHFLVRWQQRLNQREGGPATSLPDTFLEERKTDRGSSQYGGEERKKPHEIVRSSRTNKPMLGGRSQWMHRL